jgi:hypothetical protein
VANRRILRALGADTTMGAVQRRILTRLAQLVCPPGPAGAEVTAEVLAEFDRHVARLPAAVRRAMGPALVLFDQSARLRPSSRGRRFVRLSDERADAYLRVVLYRRRDPLATVVRLIKGLLVMAYYELPAVKAELGYDPATYVAQVTARRLARYGAELSVLDGGGAP